MPVVETKGSASSQGFGEFAKSGGPANYIEDVFQTWLYTGNSTSGGTQTITNNIDLSTKGGLVWIKGRSAASNHILTDTTRGAGASATNNNALASNLTDAEDLGGSSYDYLSSFSTTGFVVTQGGTTTATRGTNYNNVTYASWTFRKQAKFFDVVTYTGTGSAQTINHNLGSVPGCMIIKRTDSSASWGVYHRSLQTTPGLENKGIVYLNLTNAVAYGSSPWSNTAPTATQFTVGFAAETNASGATYIAYLFAHDAGGFGLTGTDNVISCGSFTTSGTSPNNATVNLGYEPQFLLYKISSSTGDWRIVDNMRGFLASGGSPTSPQLRPNLSNAEQNTSFVQLTSTGFTTDTGVDAESYIYVAIRRGPMKTPTSGTSVYDAVTRTGTGANATVASSFPVDLYVVQPRSNLAGTPATWINRLAGGDLYLRSNANFGEATLGTSAFGTVMNGVSLGGDTETNYSSSTFINWFMRRAPGFMDVVCYDGTNNDIALTHNLGVAPEAIILKKRSSSGDWDYDTNFTSTQHTYLTLNDTIAGSTANYSGGVNLAAQPTSTTVTVAGGAYSTSGSTYVMYLFATCAGVSKVGSYTGTGTTLQIDCGFTGGARFVLIKRTDSTGAWYVWDSARGIVAGNDPYLLLNSTAAEVTNTDYVDTYSAGFEISSTAPAAINANGGTFIFLAIA